MAVTAISDGATRRIRRGPQNCSRAGILLAVTERDEPAGDPKEPKVQAEDADARAAAADESNQVSDGGDPARATDGHGAGALPPSKIQTEAVPTHQIESAAIASGAKVPARRRIPWWYVIASLIVVEFWLYGRRGYIDVCVGTQGETDFALVGKERTDANRWKFPRCERRLNVGLMSRYEEAVDEATSVACRGATILRHQGEGKACTKQEKGWVRQIETRHVPPWHAVYYEHLFWFLY